MKKFIVFVFIYIILGSILFLILEYGFNVETLAKLFENDIEFVSETLGTFFIVFLFIILYLYINEPKKVEEQKVEEIISVTEIKGERNIIIDVVVKIIVFIIGLVLTGFLTVFLRYIFGLSGVIISLLGFLPLIFAIQYCFTTNDKNKDKE